MKVFVKIFKILLIAVGCMAAVMVILAFTSAPFWLWYDLSTSKAGIHRSPDYIIVLGGGGMPSESGLMRTWYGGKIASRYTRSLVIVACPGDTADSLSSVNLMRKELILRGIDPARIIIEPEGTNTRAQAITIYLRLTTSTPSKVHASRVTHHASLLIVTSPEHVYRAVLVFRKAGFRKVDGIPAFERTIESDLSFDDTKLGGRKWIPDIGNNINVRYQFWTQIRYEELILREVFALIYYKMKGWI